MPTKDDDFQDKDHVWITTYSDRRFHLYGDDPDEISLEDIAHATSMIVRYTGHVKKFYSVAEHQIMVADILKKWGCDADTQLVGLFHDATEAYLCDIAAPFKRELQGYYELEDMIWHRIAKKYNLLDPMPEVLKLADWTALFIEAEHLLNTDCTVWYGWEDHGPASVEFMKDHPDIKPRGMSPTDARVAWARRLEGLRNE